MRRSLIAMALCATAAGCASRVPVAGADRLAPIPPPLQARLNPPSGGSLSYWVSRPAYVAIFELIPDQGVSLIYPALPWQPGRTDGGSRWAAVSTIPGRWFYYPMRPVGNGFLPRYLYLIASERPLQLSYIQRNPNMLRRFMSPMSFAVHNPRVTTDAIDRIVVPNVESDDWVSDLFILWPRLPYIPAPRLASAARYPLRQLIIVANLPDSVTRPDSSGTPGDSLRPTRKEAEGPAGTTNADGDRVRQGDTDDSNATGGTRREVRSLAEAEDIDVPWSPPSRFERTARATEERDGLREAVREARGESPWRREAGGWARGEPGSARALREAREGESAPSRHDVREARESARPRAESPRAVPRAESPRAEPARQEPPRAEPRLDARPEPRGEPRSEPPRQPVSPPPGGAR